MLPQATLRQLVAPNPAPLRADESCPAVCSGLLSPANTPSELGCWKNPGILLDFSRKLGGGARKPAPLDSTA